jgi:hypothetical protein
MRRCRGCRVARAGREATGAFRAPRRLVGSSEAVGASPPICRPCSKSSIRKGPPDGRLEAGLPALEHRPARCLGDSGLPLRCPRARRQAAVHPAAAVPVAQELAIADRGRLAGVAVAAPGAALRPAPARAPGRHSRMPDGPQFLPALAPLIELAFGRLEKGLRLRFELGEHAAEILHSSPRTLADGGGRMPDGNPITHASTGRAFLADGWGRLGRFPPARRVRRGAARR